MNEEELCERICQLEKELLEEKEKHKDLVKRYNLLQLCYENDMDNSISKDKIKELKQLVHKTLDDNKITRAFQLVIDVHFDSILEEENE